MGALIVLTVLIICSVVINGDERDKHWVEGTITHEAGKSHASSRVVCFDDPRVCGILRRWGKNNTDITMELYFPKKYDSWGYVATTIQILQPNVIYYFPFKVRNPIYGDNHHCKLYESFESGSTGYSCNFDVNINLWSDKGNNIHSRLTQLRNCIKQQNGVPTRIRCREMLLTMLPVEKHRTTGEERPADLSRYDL